MEHRHRGVKQGIAVSKHRLGVYVGASLSMVMLVLLVQCGGTKNFDVEIQMPNYDKTVWCAVYYLSRENALNELSNVEIVEGEANYRTKPGVVDSKTTTVSLNEIKRIGAVANKAVTHILIAVNANERCARAVINVQNVDFPIKVTIDAEKCLRIDQ